jgi:farnesyl-diphosphate farnesyltransferase
MLAKNMAGTANDLLKATARSFYLTLRVLPGRVRNQIGLAYLLARTADTIADTELVPVADRLQALRRLRERILGDPAAPLEFGELAAEQGSAAERLLLEKTEDSLAALRQLSSGDRALVTAVLTTITSGQELDLRRFAARESTLPVPAGTPQEQSAGFKNSERPPETGNYNAHRRRIIALKTQAELSDYTYRVAGCVGEFWTKLCRAHLFPEARLDEAQFIADGVRFGQGLQLVNILRDLPADLKNGRCYLPTELLEPAGLTPETLLAPGNEGAFLPLYRAQLDQAEAHLRAGWRYIDTLPFGQFRVRLACAWPILLGLKTILKLRTAEVADLQRRVKVSRNEVYGIIVRSTLASPAPFLWRRLYPGPSGCNAPLGTGRARVR